MFYPSEKEFIKLTKKGNLIPVYQEILGDFETPASAYLKLAKDSRYTFLLESVEGGEKVSRYSFLAENPELIFKSTGNKAEIISFKGKKATKKTLKINHSPLKEVQKIMSRYKFVEIKGLPRFCGGFLGYIGYDAVRFFEHLPNKPKDDLKFPDILLSLTKNLIIFDHFEHKIKIISCAEINPKDSAQKKLLAYKSAQKTIRQTMSQLQKPIIKPKEKITKKTSQKIQSTFTESKFKKAVNEAKKKIRAGEIIQVVLSQRFKTKTTTSPLNIYRTLRAVNPSPYMYLLRFDDMYIVGSSPELLVRCEDGIVETRPIAGTRPRGKDEKHDFMLARDLLRDPKERAEHIMLVDLGRNDLGRVCKKGSVKLSEFMSIEHYSHVMHIVSNVKGVLKNNKDAFDVIEASFPAGTVSGAPKIRAMEIIDELEPVSRGPYAGCIGYLSFSGNLDTCITIRTIVIKGKTAYIQAGAGIVADSNPKKEYIETRNKAKAQIMAIEMANNNFA
ncbi:MAG: anthranilate synthase component I [Candidatus Aceula lacicola]|nr:anthranilate synthase component I [Candidatus Aceula lacicola]